ncbi:MAG: MFS transporter [Spirochaetales bacterium]|nr:MFS transporter [Spirochaetales bacterium]
MSDDRRHLKTYGVSYFFIFGALAAVFPFYPLLLQHKGFNPSQIGFIMGAYDLISMSGLLILGYFYDRIAAPKRTIAAIILVSAVLLLSLTLTSFPPGVIALTVVLGFFIKSPSSLLDAHFGQALPDHNESYGRTRLGGSMGFMLMALLIQVSGAVSGSRPVSLFAGYGITMIFSLAVLFFLPGVKTHEGQESGREKKSGFLNSIKTFPRLYWTGLLIGFLNSLALSGHYTFFSLMLKNRFGMENVSGFWAIGPLFEIPMFFFSTILLKKMRLRTLWSLSMLAGTTRMLFYAYSTTLLPLYLIQISHSFSFGINHFCMINLINRKTPASGRGLAMSIFTAVGMGLSLFTGGIIGGTILEFGDFPLLFQVFSFFPLAAIAINFIFLPKEVRS